MNTIRNTAFATVAAGAMFAALVLSASAGQAQTSQAVPVAAAAVVHQLPRVVVTGKVQRASVAQIVELPRVVVTGRVDRSQAVLTAANDAAPRT